MKGNRNGENGFQFTKTVFIMQGLWTIKWRYWFWALLGKDEEYISDKLIQSLTVAVLSALFLGIECIINDWDNLSDTTRRIKIFE